MHTSGYFLYNQTGKDRPSYFLISSTVEELDWNLYTLIPVLITSIRIVKILKKIIYAKAKIKITTTSDWLKIFMKCKNAYFSKCFEYILNLKGYMIS